MYAPPRHVSDPRTDRDLTVLAAMTCLEQSGCGEEALRQKDESCVRYRRRL